MRRMERMLEQLQLQLPPPLPLHYNETCNDEPTSNRTCDNRMNNN